MPHPNNYDRAQHSETASNKEKDRIARLQRQRQQFERKANRPFHVVDTTQLRLSWKRVPKDHTLSFMVILKKSIPRKLVDLKLEQAFGDLNESEIEETI